MGDSERNHGLASGPLAHLALVDVREPGRELVQRQQLVAAEVVGAQVVQVWHDAMMVHEPARPSRQTLLSVPCRYWTAASTRLFVAASSGSLSFWKMCWM